jgi:hypothetical protein
MMLDWVPRGPMRPGVGGIGKSGRRAWACEEEGRKREAVCVVRSGELPRERRLGQNPAELAVDTQPPQQFRRRQPALFLLELPLNFALSGAVDNLLDEALRARQGVQEDMLSLCGAHEVEMQIVQSLTLDELFQARVARRWQDAVANLGSDGIFEVSIDCCGRGARSRQGMPHDGEQSLRHEDQRRAISDQRLPVPQAPAANHKWGPPGLLEVFGHGVAQDAAQDAAQRVTRRQQTRYVQVESGIRLPGVGLPHQPKQLLADVVRRGEARVPQAPLECPAIPKQDLMEGVEHGLRAGGA